MTRVALPNPEQLAVAPELATVALALAATLAVCRALKAAHPVLLFPDALPNPPLDDAEHAAACAVVDAESFAHALAQYTDITMRDARALADSSLPF